MSRYDAFDDPLCYPGTQVLRNAADLTDQDDLDQFEQLMFQSRAEESLPIGNLDAAHYSAIHRHFFQDVYAWAGQFRTVRTGKGGHWFCYPEHIPREMERLFGELSKEGHLAGIEDRQHFASRAAFFVAEINAIHPFREGNGRCQLTFLSVLMDYAGFPMDEALIDPTGFMGAMIASFAGDLTPLERAILDMIG